MEFAGDPEAVARDEDTVEDDRDAAGVMRDALGLERRLAGAAPEVARLAAAEAHRRDGLVRAHDDDAELELEDLVERRPREIGPHHLVADRRREERPLKTHRMVVDQPQPLEHEHARPCRELQRLRDAPVGRGEPRPQEPRRDVLALGREIPGEAAQLENVVVDRGRGDERPETVAARDEVLALEELERLPQRHERDAEALRELALVVEPRARRERAAADPFAQRLGDAVVAWDPTDALRVRRDTAHRTSVFYNS